LLKPPPTGPTLPSSLDNATLNDVGTVPNQQQFGAG